ncbi:hypothetical protein DdX_08654 [Ditylenchus destructor]|uniref:Uncharacterized protein n=1 Tax=Ditylenchus destructor TaxID=166010 RepID=A0AAD4N7R7_9BILA|nr:hypothetical protein DdX_08654 [Ditylenchus destructor]
MKADCMAAGSAREKNNGRVITAAAAALPSPHYYFPAAGTYEQIGQNLKTQEWECSRVEAFEPSPTTLHGPLERNYKYGNNHGPPPLAGGPALQQSSSYWTLREHCAFAVDHGQRITDPIAKNPRNNFATYIKCKTAHFRFSAYPTLVLLAE